MSGAKIEAIAGLPKTYLGEGRHWNDKKNELIYVDIFGKAILRYVPSTGESAKVTVDAGPVSLVVPVEGEPNKYIITVERGVQVMEWDGVSAKPTSLKRLYTVDDHCKTNRINDGKCDAAGRLWAGTVGYEPAPGQLDKKKDALYSFGLDGKVVKHFDEIDIANGAAWTSDNSILYYIDSLTYRVDAFDFDITSGGLSNRRTAFDFKANGVDGIPDGMTIDANGNLWVAVFAGKKVVHIDPKVSKKIGQLDFPPTNMTSVAFGGPNLDILYAACAEHFLSKEDMASQPTAGSLFQVTNVGARGLAPGFNYKGPV